MKGSARGKGGGRGRGRGRGGAGKGGALSPNSSRFLSKGVYDIFIRNVPEDTTAAQLTEYFADAGKIIREPRLNLAKGYAWITFDTPTAVEEAASWSGCHFGSRMIYIHAANNTADETHWSNETHSANMAHLPALCEETVQKMIVPNPDGIFVDGTFGRGGHSRAMLAAMGPSSKLHAFDMDPEAIKVGKELMEEDPRFVIHHAPFSSMREVLKPLGISSGSLAGVFLDVGISSPQFDDATRGFRPEADGELDLRFDKSKGVPASEFLRTVDHSELVRIIVEYGEENPNGHAARRIADVVCLARSRGELPTRTKPFADLVARAKGKETSGQVMHPAKMTFQALRIHLNDEFEEMRKGMKAAFKLLREDGRLGVITWKFSERHILDDVFHALERVRDDEPLLQWYLDQPGSCPLPDGPSFESDEVIKPSLQELKRNSRARQGLLHIMHKRSLPRLAHLEKQAYSLPGWAQVVAPQGSGKEDSTAKTKRKREHKEAAAVAGLVPEQEQTTMTPKKKKKVKKKDKSREL